MFNVDIFQGILILTELGKLAKLGKLCSENQANQAQLEFPKTQEK